MADLRILCSEKAPPEYGSAAGPPNRGTMTPAERAKWAIDQKRRALEEKSSWSAAT